MKKLLFVCGKNLRRSPTAEKIFRDSAGIIVRSAGISPGSRRKLTESDLVWADLVLVMEKKHATRIKALFGKMENLPPLEILDIPDDFEFMDPELVDLLNTCVMDVLARD